MDLSRPLKFKDSLLNNRFIWILYLLPVIYPLFAIISNQVVINNTDSLAYHLYLSLLINQDNLGFFSPRPVELDNSLGLNLSAYFPWLYSHMVAILQGITKLPYQTVAWIYAIILYIFSLGLLKSASSRILFSLFCTIPIINEHLFMSGANYLQTTFLGFLLYSCSFIRNNNLKILSSFIASLLLINSHVLALAIIIPILIYQYYYSYRDKAFILIAGFIILYKMVDSYYLTGSISFPFAQNIFPNRNYNEYSLGLVEGHLSRAIFQEGARFSLGSLAFIIFTLGLYYYIYVHSTFNKYDKYLISVLLVPTLLVVFLGYRHRIIFLSLSVLIFTVCLTRNNIRLSDIFNLASQYFYKYIFIFLVFSTFLAFFIQPLRLHYTDKKQFTTLDVKKCFYSELSRLTMINDNKILFTELELMNVKNPKNLIAADGVFAVSTKDLNTNDFYNYLKNRNIKYITHTPLSTSTTTIRVDYPLNSHYDNMLSTGKISIHKDCVAEQGYNNKIYPFKSNESLANWIIYSVK